MSHKLHNSFMENGGEIRYFAAMNHDGSAQILALCSANRIGRQKAFRGSSLFDFNRLSSRSIVADMAELHHAAARFHPTMRMRLGRFVARMSA